MFEPRVAEISWTVGYDVSCGYDGCKDPTIEVVVNECWIMILE